MVVCSENISYAMRLQKFGETNAVTSSVNHNDHSQDQ